MFGKILLTAVNAVMPIILLIVLGYCLKRVKFFSKDFLKTGNKLVFRVFLPTMLFCNVYDIKRIGDIRWDVVLYSLVVIVVIFVLGLVTAILTTKRGDRRGCIWQCTFRSNFAIIGLSLAASLGGAEAERVAAIISAFSIPVFNILAVIALTVFVDRRFEVFGDEAEMKAARRAAVLKDIKKVLLGIVTNPLIIGIALGFVCLGVREIEYAVCGSAPFTISGDISFFYTALGWLKAIASPFALIVLGGQFEFSAVRGMLKEIIVGTSWRVLIAPLIGVGVAVLLTKFSNIVSFGTAEFPALVALFGSPVAVSSAIMAGEMKNDEQLATQLVVWTSLCSILTIFITVCILMSVGLLPVW